MVGAAETVGVVTTVTATVGEEVGGAGVGVDVDVDESTPLRSGGFRPHHE